MNTSIDKIPSPQTRRFERGNKQLLLALASVSMLGFAGNALGTEISITPPSVVLTTDTKAVFKISITAGATVGVTTVGCLSYTAISGTAGDILVFSGVSSITASYPISAATTGEYPITLTLSGHKQGDIVACSVTTTAGATAAGYVVAKASASLIIGAGGAGAAVQRLRVFDTTSQVTQVTYDSSNQVYPAVPPRCVNIGLVAPNATNNPIATLSVGSIAGTAAAPLAANPAIDSVTSTPNRR